MALVPLLDLRPEDPRDLAEILPANIEAEQALLGCLMYHPDAFWELPPGFGPAAFYEPFHGRIYQSIAASVSRGLSADPVMLMNEFVGDDAYTELGGNKYLVSMVDHAPPASSVPDYAHVIMEACTRRQLISLGKETTERAKRDSAAAGGTASIIADLETELLKLTITDHRLTLMDTATAGQKVIDRIRQQGEKIGGIITGLAPLDLQLGPMQAGDLVIDAARTSMGKTTLALNIAMRVADPAWWADHEVADAVFGESVSNYMLKKAEPHGVIYVSGEMTEEGVSRRCQSNIGFALFGAGMPTYQQMREGRVTVEQAAMINRAQEVYTAMPIRLLKRGGLKFSQLRSIVRRQIIVWARKGIKCGLVIGDHAHHFKPEGRTSGPYETQTELAYAAKEFAGEIEAPFLMLVQISRKTESRDDKRAQVADIRDSGAWEDCADAILFPYREAYYAKHALDAKTAEAQAEQSQLRKSKKFEIRLGKLRDGDTGDAAELWSSMGHDALRGACPPFGDLIP